jgi:hypothetical protein
MKILVVEPTALTLYRYGNYHFGLGLSVLSWALKYILCVVLAGAADIATACSLLAVLTILTSPWTSPRLLVAHI